MRENKIYSLTNHRQKSHGEAKREAQEFRAQIKTVSYQMGNMLPRLYYAPGPQRMLTLTQYLKACKMIIECQDEAQEFKMSFAAWWPKTAEDIRTGEIWPSIHERINARGLMEERERARWEEMSEHSEEKNFYIPAN